MGQLVVSVCTARERVNDRRDRWARDGPEKTSFPPTRSSSVIGLELAERPNDCPMKGLELKGFEELVGERVRLSVSGVRGSYIYHVRK